MRWYVLDHEQFLSFSILLSSHHSGTSWSLSHLSIGCCSRTVKAFLDVVWQTNLVFLFLRLTNGLDLVVNPLYSLWWSLLLIVDFDTHTPTTWSVLDLASCCEGVFLQQGKNCSVIHHSYFPWTSGSFVVAEPKTLSQKVENCVDVPIFMDLTVTELRMIWHLFSRWLYASWPAVGTTAHN